MATSDDDIVEVYSAGNVAEAQFLCDLLEEAGIRARSVGGLLANLPPLGEDTMPRVWVFRADEDRARELIDEYERVHSAPHSDQDTPAATWTCPTCGQDVDADFELCWNCQTPNKPY
ncbi:MAG: DUF2007 domain-containing protein [Planctomycetales bacterium]